MKKLLLALALALLPASAHAWTFLTDNILGKPLDYVTVRSPNNNDILKFNSTTGKWAAVSAAAGSTITIKTGGVSQGSADTLDFTNGLVSSSTATAGTFNVSPTYGTSANTITQGNDARHNVTPAAGVRGNIAAVNAGGTAWTSIDEGTATDQALMSLGANTPGAFRALIATDIDELLASSDLTDFSTAKTGTGTSVVSNAGPTITGVTTLSIIGAADQALNAASAGQLQRNGAELSWHNGTAATNIEQVGRKNAANGYAGLSGTSKLTASQGQEVWASSDLTDFSATKSGTGNSVVSDAGSTIAGLILSTFASFTDQVANAGSAGRLQRNGAELSWHNGTAATNLEQVGRKDAASGYAGLTAGSKLNAGQGQEVWSFSDLSNVASMTEAVGDIIRVSSIGPVVWDRLAKGSNSTVLQVSSGGTLQYSTVTDAMLAGSISDGKLATSYVKADGTRALTADWGVGNFAVTGVKELRFQGQAGDPAGFAEGGISYDTTDGVPHVKGKVGVMKVGGTFHQVNGSTTITTTGSDQTFTEATFNLPANICQDGGTIAFNFAGVYSSGTSAPGNWTFKLVKGSTTLLAGTALGLGASETNQGWKVMGEINFRASNLAAIDMFVFFGANNFGSRNFQANSTNGTVSFTSANEDLKLVINMPAPGAGTNTITLQSGSWVHR